MLRGSVGEAYIAKAKAKGTGKGKVKGKGKATAKAKAKVRWEPSEPDLTSARLHLDAAAQRDCQQATQRGEDRVKRSNCSFSSRSDFDRAPHVSVAPSAKLPWCQEPQRSVCSGARPPHGALRHACWICRAELG